MSESAAKPKIGLMGSARTGMSGPEVERLTQIAQQLGQAIAERDCVLVTGATSGFPDIVSRAARKRGGLTIGISPASSREEHCSRYLLPDDGADVIVYTGFGLKGRNVINVRSSDVVVILGGGMGTLNEFTVAYDEGKVVGVLVGSGGAADQIREIAKLSTGPEGTRLVFESTPEALIDACLKALAERY